MENALSSTFLDAVAVLAMATLCTAIAPTPATAAEAAVGTVRISLITDAKPELPHIAAVLERQIAQRCPATFVEEGVAPLTIELAIDRALPEDAFTLAETGGKVIRITGANARGALLGVGKFLRGCRFTEVGFIPGRWRGSSTPRCRLRAIYLATHFNNFYEAAPLTDVKHYVEELGLWGYNAIFVHFPTWQFTGLDDPAARKWLERFKLIASGAKQCGLQLGLVQCTNQGYKNTAAELKGTKVPGNLRGNFGVNLCPSKPEARKILLQLYDALFDELRGCGIDYLCCWPYDEGGCACEQCWPWGARGYLSLSKEMSQHFRSKFPEGKILLSTWGFENEKDANPDGEWVGLAKALHEDKSWLEYIMADGHDNYFPRYVLKNGVPGGLPLLNFPEISMFGMNPWGGYGANPAPAHFQALWNHIKDSAGGGMPYSEGIYEDINKAICAQFYWDPERKAEDTVKEYAAFEFTPEAADDLVEVVKIFELNHSRRGIHEGAKRAYEQVIEAEKKMTEKARQGWRWRIFCLRALIDKELFESKGKFEGEKLKTAFDELTRIYYAQNAGPMPLKPPQIK